MTPLPRPHSLRWAAGLLATAGVLSCGESLGPGSFAGVYVLRAIGSDPLPAVVSSNENVTIFVLADTLRLASNGAGLQVGLRRILPAAGEPVDTIRIEWPLYYEAAPPGRIEVTYVCPPNALCTAGPHLVGGLTADGLYLEGAVPDGPPLSYERVSPPLLPVGAAR